MKSKSFSSDIDENVVGNCSFDSHMKTKEVYSINSNLFGLKDMEKNLFFFLSHSVFNCQIDSLKIH